jgi:hypothetical protein
MHGNTGSNPVGEPSVRQLRFTLSEHDGAGDYFMKFIKINEGRYVPLTAVLTIEFNQVPITETKIDQFGDEEERETGKELQASLQLVSEKFETAKGEAANQLLQFIRE